MASSKVMASSTSRNADLSRCTSSSTTKLSSISDHNNSNSSNNNKNNNNTLASMTVDGILRNIYSDTPSTESTLLNAEITLLDAPTTTSTSSTNETTNNTSIKESSSNFPNKTVDDVWKEIVAGERKVCKEEAPDEMMTLEDFLARAGAVEEEDVKMPPRAVSGGVFSSFDPIQTTPFQPGTLVEGFGNGVEVRGVGRGKRKAVVLEPLDKAAQQRQRRMIKNRESAARSRERKQAYQVELEALAVKLEEENDRLLKEKAERTKERFKLLMEKVIPVVEQRRPARTLRRVRSMHW